MKPVFGVNGAGAVALIMGIISGYPAGAAVTCRLYREKLINRGEALRLLTFTNNPGPLFIIGAVGTAILFNAKAGYILWFSNFLSALLTGIIMRFTVKNDYYISEAPKSSGYKKNAVTEAAMSMLSLCGYVVFFSVILAFAKDAGFIGFLTGLLTKMGFSEINTLFISQGFFELTTAVYKCSGASLPFISAILSWGGLSVLLQTAGIVKDSELPLNSYLSGKIACSLLSLIICNIFLKFANYSSPVFECSINPSKLNFYFAYLFISILLSVLILLFFSTISRITRNEKKDFRNNKISR